MSDVSNRLSELVPKWWPVILFVGTLSASTATSQAQVAGVNARVDRIDTIGTAYGIKQGADTRERLARIEQAQQDDRKLLERMAHQLDNIEQKVN